MLFRPGPPSAGARVGLALAWLAGLLAPGLTGCQGTGVTLAPQSVRRVPAALLTRTSFTIAPLGASLPDATPLLAPIAVVAPEPEAVATVSPVPAAPAPLADRLSVQRVRVLGVARVPEDATGMANVREGFITGTPVVVRDARSGRRLAEAVTFYDGSFTLDVPLEGAALPVIVSTSLVDAADPRVTTSITAPAVLRRDQGEHRLALTPGSTALTAFLEAVAGIEKGTTPDLSGSLADPAFAAGPRLGALIAGIDEGERESFARLAEAAPELKAASDVPTLRDGIRRFVGRIAVRKAG
ncbi:MAG: hypothetical protein VKS61_02040 [Candidatus Sericytochromatia bacterium]|nr:hypothetical protein [Candidatus Sericytochromatia bacterium]